MSERNWREKEFFIYLKIDKERQDFDYKNEVNNLL